MGKKGKQKVRQREKRAQAKRKQRRVRQPRGPARIELQGDHLEGEHLPAAPFDPPQPDRLRPPVHLDRSGSVVPDPWAVLGLAPGDLDRERIRQAWRTGIEAHPPEAEPERAREIRDARDRLLDPERIVEREFAVLRAPDPVAWGLDPELPPTDPDRLDAEARLIGQGVLYALVEQELIAGGLGDWLEERARR